MFNAGEFWTLMSLRIIRLSSLSTLLTKNLWSWSIFMKQFACDISCITLFLETRHVCYDYLG